VTESCSASYFREAQSWRNKGGGRKGKRGEESYFFEKKKGGKGGGRGDVLNILDFSYFSCIVVLVGWRRGEGGRGAGKVIWGGGKRGRKGGGGSAYPCNVYSISSSIFSVEVGNRNGEGGEGGEKGGGGREGAGLGGRGGGGGEGGGLASEELDFFCLLAFAEYGGEKKGK